MHAHTQVLVLFVFTFVFAFLSLFIYVEFGWKTYVLVDCNPGMRCKWTNSKQALTVFTPSVFVHVCHLSPTTSLPWITQLHKYTNSQLYMHVHTCTCMYIRACACTYVHMHVHTCSIDMIIFMHTHTHTWHRLLPSVPGVHECHKALPSLPGEWPLANHVHVERVSKN